MQIVKIGIVFLKFMEQRQLKVANYDICLMTTLKKTNEPREISFDLLLHPVGLVEVL